MSTNEEKGRLCFQQIQGYEYFKSSKIAKYHTFLDIIIPIQKYQEYLFVRTIEALYHSNRSLSIVIHSQDNNIYQTITYPTEIKQYIDFHICMEDSVADNIRSVAKQQACENMNLEGGFLSRVAVIVYPDGKADCMFLLHHIIADQMSMAILEHQFLSIYSKLINNNQCALEMHENPLSYSILDYANWQYDNWNKKKDQFIKFWHSQLGIYNEKLVPNLIRNSSIFECYNEEHSLNNLLNDSFSGYYVQVLDSNLRDSLYQIASHLQNSISAAIVGLFELIPYYYTGRDQSLLALVMRDNYYPKVRELVGPCTGAIYVTKKQDQEDCTYESYFQSVFFSIMQSAKYLITDHASLGLHGRLLRLNCDFFLNIFPSFLNVKLDQSYYTGEAYKDSHIYYALECNVYEQADHICIIWGYNKSLYLYSQIIELSHLLEKLILHISSNYKSTKLNNDEIFN